MSDKSTSIQPVEAHIVEADSPNTSYPSTVTAQPSVPQNYVPQGYAPHGGPQQPPAGYYPPQNPYGYPPQYGYGYPPQNPYGYPPPSAYPPPYAAGQQNVSMSVNLVQAGGSTSSTPTGANAALRLIAFIWNLLCTIGVCWLIIPLIWMIPLTVMTWGIYKGTRKNTVGFGIVNLLFMSLVSGILLLCAKKE